MRIENLKKIQNTLDWIANFAWFKDSLNSSGLLKLNFIFVTFSVIYRNQTLVFCKYFWIFVSKLADFLSDLTRSWSYFWLNKFLSNIFVSFIAFQKCSFNLCSFIIRFWIIAWPVDTLVIDIVFKFNWNQKWMH